ncbi:cellulose biosynthesis protein BcsQ [Neisseriaceae bacterium TC5R-5]|nr:cellulose biosynthesis protein BcsQ [Neisseriaceae bacterium TC5R-5]
MAILAITGIKGGCGASTVTAGLAFAWAQQHRSILAMDLCRRNLLRLHLGLPWQEQDGWYLRLLKGEDWTQAAWQLAERLDFVPYGEVAFATPAALLDAEWLQRELARLQRPPDDKVLLDTPSEDGPLRRLALHSATHVLVVLPPDAMAYGLLSALAEELQSSGVPATRTFFLLNRVELTQQLDRDIELLFRSKLAEQMTPLPLMRDEALREAVAKGQPVAMYAPGSQAADDLRQLAMWLAIRLEPVRGIG